MCLSHIFPNAASPTRGFNQHVKACPRQAVSSRAAMEVVMHLVCESEGFAFILLYQAREQNNTEKNNALFSPTAHHNAGKMY